MAPRDSVPSVNASPRPAHPHDVGLDEIALAVHGLSLRPDGDTLVESRPAASPPPRVTGVTLDSRTVRPGDLYAALPGAHVHGAAFAQQAASSGAVALLTDAAGVEIVQAAGVGLPVLVAEHPRGVLGDVAALVYGSPSQDLIMVGITGTNGKTTTAYLLEGAVRGLGRSTGLIGTIETRVGDERLPSVRTTPEATDLHGLLAVMVERGTQVCAMEVSSHALALHRVDAVRYDVAIFTNLSQDHLDFHRTMEEYFAAKAELFTPERAERAVVCVDDAWGRRLAGSATIPTTTLANEVVGDAARGGGHVGGHGGGHVGGHDGTPDADWTIEATGPGAPGRAGAPGSAAAGADDAASPAGAAGGPRMTLRHRDGRRVDVRVGLPGAHNATNTALAYVALLELVREGALAVRDESQLARAFDIPAQVPGRMQLVALDRTGAQSAAAGAASTTGDAPIEPPIAYVDFAHTPEAVAATLSALAGTAAGPLVAVLGAGGDRDPGKRPGMGAAAARVADIVVVTDDNPRHEDPATIRAALAGGARDADRGPVHDVAGRAAGIRRAIELAAGAAGRPPGVVAVLGKGHESGQTIGDVVTPFDDAQAVREAWAGVREAWAGVRDDARRTAGSPAGSAAGSRTGEQA